MKRITAFILALTSLILPAHAGGENSAPEPNDFVEEIMEANFIKDGSYAIGFRSLYDGETWLCNANEYFKVASVYKMPLNMYFYEQEAAGEIAPDELVAGMALDTCHWYSLEYSNNEISEAMVDYLGGYAQFKRDILKYIGDAADDVTNEYYYDNAFTAEMVLNILDYLYTNADVFRQQLEHMLAAQPGEYLKSGELGCDIAQKYGYQVYDGVLHIAVAGIVYADEPILLTVLTRRSYGAVEAMGELCDAFAAWEKDRVGLLREEEAERQEAERLEAERLAELERHDSAAKSETLKALCAAASASPLPGFVPWRLLFSELEGSVADALPDMIRDSK